MTTSMTNNRLEIVIFCSLVATWILVYALIAPPFGGTDVFIFKDAGSNLALGQGFKSIPAPFFDGDPTPRIFSSYTPFYPLLYGLWGLSFGIGPYSNAYFDLFLAIVASSLTLFLLMPALEQRRERLLSAVIVGITVPAGGVFMLSDRAEILGYAFSVMVLLLWRKARGSACRSISVVGASALVFLANPFAGLVTLMIVSVLLITDQPESPSLKPSGIARVRLLSYGWLLFVIICASTAFLLFTYDHDALRRFSEHSLGRNSGAGVLRNINGIRMLWSFYLVQWRHAFLSSSISSFTMASSLVVCFAIAVPYVAWVLREPASSHIKMQNRIIGAFVIGLFFVPVLLFPRQNNYYVLDRALIPIFLLISRTSTAELLRRVRLPLVLIGAGVLCAVPEILVELAQRCENHTSYEYARQEVRAITADIDQSKYIAISSTLYPIVKPIHPKLVNVQYLDRADKAYFVDGLIISRANSRFTNATRIPLPAALADIAWQPLNHALPPVFIRLFGRQVMRSQWGWGVDGYRR